jgi:hypothetical protein
MIRVVLGWWLRWTGGLLLVVWVRMLMLGRRLMLRSLRLLGERAMEGHRARIDMAVGQRGVMGRARGELPWSSTVLAVLIEVNELLMPHEEIANVHVSILWRARVERVEEGRGSE